MNTPEILHLTAELDDNVVLVSANPSYVRSYAAFNPGSEGVYLHLMNVATAVEGAIIGTIFLPAGGGANLSGLQWRFTAGIAIVASSSVAGFGAPANAIVVNIGHG